MSKSDTIAAIMRINRSAPAEFLAEFSSEELQNYLDRLGSPQSRYDGSVGPSAPSGVYPGAAQSSKTNENPFRFTPTTA